MPYGGEKLLRPALPDLKIVAYNKIVLLSHQNLE
jgi:hypothetical protein